MKFCDQGYILLVAAAGTGGTKKTGKKACRLCLPGKSTKLFLSTKQGRVDRVREMPYLPLPCHPPEGNDLTAPLPPLVRGALLCDHEGMLGETYCLSPPKDCLAGPLYDLYDPSLLGAIGAGYEDLTDSPA